MSSHASETDSVGLSPKPTKHPENVKIVKRKHMHVESAIAKKILTEKKVASEQSLESDQFNTAQISRYNASLNQNYNYSLQSMN